MGTLLIPSSYLLQFIIKDRVKCPKVIYVSDRKLTVGIIVDLQIVN
jgi:hypothetical protein